MNDKINSKIAELTKEIEDKVKDYNALAQSIAKAQEQLTALQSEIVSKDYAVKELKGLISADTTEEAEPQVTESASVN